LRESKLLQLQFKKKKEERKKVYDLFVEKFTTHKKIRQDTDVLKQQKDFENYLILQEKVCYSWKFLDSLWNAHSKWWEYDDYY
jgi:hypothetical protein